MTRIKVEANALLHAGTEAIALFVFEDEKDNQALKAIDSRLDGHVSSLIKKKKFQPKKLAVRAMDTLGKIKPETLILAGLGKRKDMKPEVVRQAAAKAAATLAGLGVKSFSFTLDGIISKNSPAEVLAQAAAEGIILSQYRFAHYQKNNENGKKPIDNVVIMQTEETPKVKLAAARAEKICEGVYLARDLQNHPGNVATPSFIADRARAECKKAGVRCRVLGKPEIERLKMGSFLGVAKGSAQPPRFVIMEYMNGKKGEKPIVLVGKGLTFDSGGISIKPSSGMEEMKFDMSGGAAVIGAMIAAARLKLKMNLVGLVPCTENMPGGKANKPGDILKSMGGTTIEVLNTDAEGRLILADALEYAKRYKPKAVVDLATLTGACMVALGSLATGLFGNDEKLIAALKDAGDRTGERCWPMPLWEEYDEEIKSKVADVQNIGGRYGGAITAAAFLKKFTDYPWAHMDIAGTAYHSKPPTPYLGSGGAGVGVRQLIDFLEKGI